MLFWAAAPKPACQIVINIYCVHVNLLIFKCKVNTYTLHAYVIMRMMRRQWRPPSRPVPGREIAVGVFTEIPLIGKSITKILRYFALFPGKQSSLVGREREINNQTTSSRDVPLPCTCDLSPITIIYNYPQGGVLI